MVCPVALAGSMSSVAAASVMVATSLSTPATTMCSGGRLLHSRALPSLLTSMTLPVLATRALAPVMPASAAMNLSRRYSRAACTSVSGSGGRSCPVALPISSAARSRVMCSAGATMCEGSSSATCIRNSPRSVSITSSPSASSDWRSPISSVAMDLLFTTMRAEALRNSSATVSCTAAASAGGCTTMPAFSATAVNCRSRRGPSATSRLRIAASRACSAGKSRPWNASRRRPSSRGNTRPSAVGSESDASASRSRCLNGATVWLTAPAIRRRDAA